MIRSESDLKSDMAVTVHGRDPHESGQDARAMPRIGVVAAGLSRHPARNRVHPMAAQSRRYKGRGDPYKFFHSPGPCYR
jgi:hypothetical protein